MLVWWVDSTNPGVVMWKMLESAWQTGWLGHVVGSSVAIGILHLGLYYTFENYAEDQRKNLIRVNYSTLGSGLVLRSPELHSYVYQKGTDTLLTTIVVYRVGDLYTAKVIVQEGHRRSWGFIRSASPAEKQIWNFIFPGPYVGQSVVPGRPTVDSVGSLSVDSVVYDYVEGYEETKEKH